MKRIFSILFFSLSFLLLKSQNLAFRETFEMPGGADSISANASTATSGTPWSVTSQVASEGSQSFRAAAKAGDTAYFETEAFSTEEYVILSFDHIAKLQDANRGRIQISVDSGATWQNIPGKHYTGESFQYHNNRFFNEGAYGSIWQAWKLASNSLWQHETFNLRGLASDTVNNNGYSHVKLRFKLEGNIDSLLHTAWYIDNIVVQTSSCNFKPVDISWFIQPVPCFQNHPTGELIVSSGGSHRIAVRGASSQGIQNAYLHYEIHKADGTQIPPDSILMQRDSGGNQVGAVRYNGSEIFYADIQNIQENDTVYYYVRFHTPSNSCSSGIVQSPESGYFKFHISPELSPMCGQPNCNVYPEIIHINDNSLPWIENFESGRWKAGNNGSENEQNQHRGEIPDFPDGSWFVGPSLAPVNKERFAWCVGDSATFTPETGPDGNHTPGGSNYMFTEGSLGTIMPGQQNVIAQLMTPCIDLTENTAPTAFEMYYHMYGDSGMHVLRVDIDTGSLYPVTNQIRMEKPQQSSGSDPWKRAILPLEDYNGKIIKLNIMAVKKWNSERVDFAIDDLRISKINSKDVSIADNLLPSQDACDYSSSEEIRILLQNTGSSTITEIPLAYQINNSSIIRDTADVNLVFMDTISFTFSNPADLSQNMTHHIKIWSELAGDADPTQDTIEFSIDYKSSISSFPFTEDLESSVPASSLSETGELTSPYFHFSPLTSPSQWIVYEGPVRDTVGGPQSGSHKSGNYMLFRGQKEGDSDNEASFISSCIDFSSLSHPMMSFKYFKDEGAKFRVDIREKGDEAWTDISPPSLQNASSKADEYRYAKINLSSYAGKNMEVRFTALVDIGDNFGHSYFALDDISFYENSPNDLHLISLNTPYLTGGGNSMDINISSAKSGTSYDHLSNVSLGIEMEDICTSGMVYSGQSNPFIFSNNASLDSQDVRINFSSTVPAGLYRCKIWQDVQNDSKAWNDTLIKIVKVIAPVGIPYSTGFEDCFTPFYTYEAFLDWEATSPGKDRLNSAHSGSKAMITHPTEMLRSSEEILYSPVFVGYDSLYQATLSFYHKFEFSNEGYGAIEYYDSDAGKWKNLTGTARLDGKNWMNSPYIKNVQEYEHRLAFSGFSGEWIPSSYPLEPSFLKGKDSLQLRFIAHEDYLEGWVIDDLEITPSKVSVAPVSVHLQTIPEVGNQDISFKVKNTGSADIYSFDIDISLNGNSILSRSFNLSTPLLSLSDTIISISSISLSSGSNQLEIISSLPNSRADHIREDDTLSLNIYLSEHIDSLPSCSELEDDQLLFAYDKEEQIIDTSWVYGNPKKNHINGAYSGQNCWYISGAEKYGPLFDQHLYTPTYVIQKRECYRFSFRHSFDTEQFADGGTVEYSVDSGLSWNVLGAYGDTNWYNTEHIEALDLIHPGWSGLSEGWEAVHKDIKLNHDTVIQFRFRFASGFQNHYEGWAIDDICFEPLDSSCKVTSVEELRTNGEMRIYPNPAQDELNIEIPFMKQNSSSYKLEIIDQRGMIIRRENIAVNGNGIHTMNIRNFSSGIYIVRIWSASRGYIAQERLVKNNGW